MATSSEDQIKQLIEANKKLAAQMDDNSKLALANQRRQTFAMKSTAAKLTSALMATANKTDNLAKILLTVGRTIDSTVAEFGADFSKTAGKWQLTAEQMAKNLQAGFKGVQESTLNLLAQAESTGQDTELHRRVLLRSVSQGGLTFEAMNELSESIHDTALKYGTQTENLVKALDNLADHLPALDLVGSSKVIMMAMKDLTATLPHMENEIATVVNTLVSGSKKDLDVRARLGIQDLAMRAAQARTTQEASDVLSEAISRVGPALLAQVGPMGGTGTPFYNIEQILEAYGGKQLSAFIRLDRALARGEARDAIAKKDRITPQDWINTWDTTITTTMDPIAKLMAESHKKFMGFLQEMGPWGLAALGALQDVIPWLLKGKLFKGLIGTAAEAMGKKVAKKTATRVLGQAAAKIVGRAIPILAVNDLIGWLTGESPTKWLGQLGGEDNWLAKNPDITGGAIDELFEYFDPTTPSPAAQAEEAANQLLLQGGQEVVAIVHSKSMKAFERMAMISDKKKEEREDFISKSIEHFGSRDHRFKGFINDLPMTPPVFLWR